MREFARLREADVTERELRLAQEYAIGTHAIRQQSGGAVLGELIDAFMMGRGLAELDEHDARIRAVTAKAMREVAKTYFDEGRLVQAVIRGNSKGASGN
jgi:zinc protease